MKNILKTIETQSRLLCVLAIALIVGLSIIACGSPSGFGDGANNQGTILINLGSKNSDIRSVMPWPSEDSEILEYIDYKITFKGPGTTKTITAKNGETKKESVSAGLWTITIDAYLEGFQTPLTPNGERMHYATGGNSINVKAGKTNEVSLPMTAEFCRDCDWVITLAACTVPHKATVEKCTNNNHIGVERIISGMLGHKWEYLGVAPTCTTSGSGIQKCEVCKTEETLSVIPPLGHKWEYFGIAPTCTTAGSGTQKCEVCKIEETLTIIDPLEHKWSNWTVISTTYPAQSSRTCIHGCIDTPRNRQIGDIGPVGGIIFYIAPLGFNFYTGSTTADNSSELRYYLEAAPAVTEFYNAWGAIGYDITGMLGSIGAGLKNTRIVINYLESLSVPETVSAAHLCNNLEHNGYNDWFLPNRAELDEMYNNLKAATPSLGNFIDAPYWSSSQVSMGYTITKNFTNGSDSSNARHVSWYIRAVRAF